MHTAWLTWLTRSLALSAGTVSAEDVLQTETVHVTASRVEQELMEVPMSV